MFDSTLPYQNYAGSIKPHNPPDSYNCPEEEMIVWLHRVQKYFIFNIDIALWFVAAYFSNMQDLIELCYPALDVF